MTDAASNIHHKSKGRVLAVDDDFTTLTILTSLLEDMSYDVLEAGDGMEALGVIERESDNLDVIVLDKNMPVMDGIAVVNKLKYDPKAAGIPIVMVTGSDSPEEFKEGIDAGVYYYLTKPYDDNVFRSVMEAAMREAMRRSTQNYELKKKQTSFNFIKQADFEICTIEDAEDLARFIAYCFPHPETALPGLSNLIVNAVEHGNLGIDYEVKSELLKKGKWREKIAELESLPENAKKRVFVRLFSDDNETKVIIKDEGAGFDWAKFMEIDPSRALDNHGRGIAQANKISFDSLTYNAKGNEVTAISFNESDIEW